MLTKQQIVRNLRFRLQVVMHEEGWSQHDLARRANLPFATINYTLRSSSRPSLITAYFLAEACGLTLDQLIAPLVGRADRHWPAAARPQRDPGNTSQ